MAKHLYRKKFDSSFEAEETANGFRLVSNIDRPGPSDVAVREEDGSFYIYVTFEGDVDPNELFDATGYERVL